MTWEEKQHTFVVSANEQATQTCDEVSPRGKGEERNRSSLISSPWQHSLCKRSQSPDLIPHSCGCSVQLAHGYETRGTSRASAQIWKQQGTSLRSFNVIYTNAGAEALLRAIFRLQRDSSTPLLSFYIYLYFWKKSFRKRELLCHLDQFRGKLHEPGEKLHETRSFLAATPQALEATVTAENPWSTDCWRM